MSERQIGIGRISHWVCKGDPNCLHLDGDQLSCFACNPAAFERAQSPLATNVRSNGMSINNGQGETADSLRERVRELEARSRRWKISARKHRQAGLNWKVWGEAWEQNAHAAEVRVGELEGALLNEIHLLEIGRLNQTGQRVVAKRLRQALSASPTKDQSTETPQISSGGGE